jgi:hypothetical protein
VRLFEFFFFFFSEEQKVVIRLGGWGSACGQGSPGPLWRNGKPEGQTQEAGWAELQPAEAPLAGGDQGSGGQRPEKTRAWPRGRRPVGGAASSDSRAQAELLGQL